MDLHKLRSELIKKFDSGDYDLDNTTIQSPRFQFILDVISPEKLQFSEKPAVSEIVDEKFTIKGPLTLYGVDTNGTVTLEIVDKDLEAAFSSSLADLSLSDMVNKGLIPKEKFDPSLFLDVGTFESITLEISSIELNFALEVEKSGNEINIKSIGFKLNNIGFLLNGTVIPGRTAKRKDFQLMLFGEFQIGSITLKVALAFPTGILDRSSQFSIRLSSPQSLKDWINALSSLFGKFSGVTGISELLPPGISQLAEISLDNLQINFSLDPLSIYFIQVQVSTTKPWSVIPIFTIEEVGFQVSLSNGTDISAYIFGKFKFGKDENNEDIHLEISMTIPPGENDWVISMSTGDFGDYDFGITSFEQFLPGGEYITGLLIPKELREARLTINNLEVAFNPKSQSLSSVLIDLETEFNWKILEFNSTTILAIGDPFLDITITNPLNDNRELLGRFGGNVYIGDLEAEVIAEKTDPKTGWELIGRTVPGSYIDILELANHVIKPFGIEIPPSIFPKGLKITDLGLTYRFPTETVKWAVTFQGRTDEWKFEVGDLSFSLSAELYIHYEPSNGFSGYMRGETKFLKIFDIRLGFEFEKEKKELSIEWQKMKGVLSIEGGQQTLSLEIGDKSVGEILADLVGLITGDMNFKLPPPWDILNMINLNGLKLSINLTTSDVTIIYTPHPAIDLFFIKIDKITFKKAKSPKINSDSVLLDFEGSFLGKKIGEESPLKNWDLLNDPTPEVPGQGTRFFDLELLAMGQRVSLKKDEDFDLNTIDGIIKAMKKAFQEPKKDEIPVSEASLVQFNPNSNWLVGTWFKLLGSTIDLKVIFNDPEMYGLKIVLGGEKAGQLAGLDFEILYRKINDTIGVYQAELTLPDALRYLEFSAASVTLPVVGIEIYTNGNFFVDIGFPFDMDFTRSCTIQVIVYGIPLLGSGGVYFGLLNGDTSPRLPADYRKETGIFNPVIAIGVGIQLGLGKSIKKGPISGGFKVVFLGIIEGTFAFFDPTNKDNRNDVYYFLKGTFGCIGEVFGKIDLAIIQVDLKLSFTLAFAITMESYRPIILGFIVKAELKLLFKINLGIFRINISLSYTLELRESLKIELDQGHGPWALITDRKRLIGPPSDRFGPGAAPREIPVMNWKPIERVKKDPLNIYFLPQVTVEPKENESGGSEKNQVAKYIAILFLKTSALREGMANEKDGFDALCEALLLWIISSLIDQEKTVTEKTQILVQTVTREKLKQIYTYLDQKGITPLPYQTITAFLENYFDIILTSDSEKRDKEQSYDVSVFPMIPIMTLSAKHNQEPKKEIANFEEKTKVTDKYHEQIIKHFEELAIQYQNETEKKHDPLNQKPGDQQKRLEELKSLATYIFEDYFLLLAKALVQNALDLLTSQTYTVKEGDSLQRIIDTFPKETKEDLTPGSIASANSTQPLQEGVKLELVNIQYPIQGSESLEQIAQKFNVTDIDAFTEALGDINTNKDTSYLLKEGVVIKVGEEKEYKVRPKDTLAAIAKSFDITPGKVLIFNKKRTDILQSFTRIECPIVFHAVQENETFESIANIYSVTMAALAESNKDKEGIFPPGKKIRLLNLLAMNIEMLVEGLKENYSFKHLSGMAARYLLEGLRLPFPGDDDEKNQKAGSLTGTTVSLYDLTNQQFALPDLVETDEYTIYLEKNEYVNMEWFRLDAPENPNNIEITFTKDEINTINTLKKTTLSPTVHSLEKLKYYREESKKFTLSDKIFWQIDEPIETVIDTSSEEKIISQPGVWHLPLHLRELLNTQKSQTENPRFILMIGRQVENAPMQETAVKAFSWSTTIPLTIHQLAESETYGLSTLTPYTFEIEGTDAAGIDMLEKFLIYNARHGGKKIIDRIYVLYPANPSEPNSEGLKSDGIDSLDTFILQTNLSTLSNPDSDAFALAGLAEQIPGNMINKEPVESLKLIWEASIVRSGGFYLYYRNSKTNAGLPIELFSENKSVELKLVITYKLENNALPNFINSSVIEDEIEESNVVFAIADHQEIQYKLSKGTAFNTVLENYHITLSELADIVKDKQLADNAAIRIAGVRYKVSVEDLEAAARRFQVSEQEIRELNPEVDFEKRRSPIDVRIPLFQHKVKGKSETLQSVANEYGASLNMLVAQNKDQRNLFKKEITFSFDNQLRTRTAIIPQGNTGFDLKRKNPDQTTTREMALASVSSETTLELLFNLLSYKVEENDYFKGSIESLPVGPAGSEVKPRLDPDAVTLPHIFNSADYWEYKQVVPVFNFKKDNHIFPDETDLPDPGKNPYLGIGHGFDISFRWQDMYGNQTRPLPKDLEVSVGYFDEIVNIQRWPGIGLAYNFKRIDEQPKLQIFCSFDVGKYIPGEDKEPAIEYARKLAEGDLELYKTIYYQINQPDFTFSISTSIQPKSILENPAIKKQLIEFVNTIYSYLDTIRRPDYKFRFHPVVEGDTFARIALQYDVPEADLRRINPRVNEPLVIGETVVIPAETPDVKLPPNIVLSEMVEFTNPAVIFELNVELMAKRDKTLVDDQFLDIPEVYAASALIKPLTEAITGENNNTLTLHNFARLFEGTYPEKKAAAGFSKEDATTANGFKKIWVVRFDKQDNKGITYEIKDNPNFFATIPLFNSLITGKDFKIYEYKTGKGWDGPPIPPALKHSKKRITAKNSNDLTDSKETAKPIYKTFSGIDLDTWARGFLAAVDQLLSPEYVIPLFIVDHIKNTQYYQSLLNAKKKLAAAIKETVFDIIAKPELHDTPGRKDACDTLEQQLLIKLSNAYTIDTIVQYEVDVINPEPSPGKYPPKLFGQPIGNVIETIAGEENENREYSLSTARISLKNGKTYLTLLFSSNRKKEKSNIHLQLDYQVSSMEHEIHEPIPDIEGYQASSWLSFIIPLRPRPMSKKVQIPIPLKAYPTSPSLVDQRAESIIDENKNESQGGEEIEFKDTKRWIYKYSYKQVEAAQDTIHTSIKFNIKDVPSERKESELPDLFESLAMFISVYPQIQEDFIKTLSNINQDSSEKEIETASKAVEAFTTLTEYVTLSWGNWLGDKVKYRDTVQSQEDYEYVITESKKGDLKIEIEEIRSKGDIEIPSMFFKGYETITIEKNDKKRSYKFKKDDEYLTVDASRKFVRTVQFGGALKHGSKQNNEEKHLNILDKQNAWGSVRIRRNEYLFDKEGKPDKQKPTYEDFIYQTPYVRFSNIVTPLLDYSEGFNIAKLVSEQSEPKTLLAHLNGLFTQLFAEISTETGKRMIKVICSYRYQFREAAEEENIEVNLPILLVAPFEFEIPADWSMDCELKEPGFICKLSKAVKDGWYEKYKPSTAHGKFIFDISVYSSLSDSKLPVLRLRNLYLELSDIKDL
jgi:LysM repeat protein